MQRFDLYPAKVIGDKAYGSAEILSWLVYEHGIEPVFDESVHKGGTFSREDFTYDYAGDVYNCLAARSSPRAALCLTERPCVTAPASTIAKLVT